VQEAAGRIGAPRNARVAAVCLADFDVTLADQMHRRYDEVAEEQVPYGLANLVQKFNAP
jgi:hypothetical protein